MPQLVSTWQSAPVAEVSRPSMATKRLLLVEDDRAIAELVEFHFAREGYAVTQTANGEEALILVDEIRPDLIVLDWMIEGISGIELCRRLRRKPATANLPIIMLTARGEEDDRLRGLETGADDYVTKPFSPKELVVRAAAVLRRVRPALAAEALSYAGLEMDLGAHRVRRDGKALNLGPTEYRLLRHFLEHPGRVFSRQQLLETVWPHSEEIELRTVDVHIRRLRMALGKGGGADLVRTVRSAGYALDAEGTA
jgi:two-component system phosphate regulon response regulator PhoB